MPESGHDKDFPESDDPIAQVTDSSDLDPWRDHPVPPPLDESTEESRMLDDLSVGPEPVVEPDVSVESEPEPEDSTDKPTEDTSDDQDDGPLALFPDSYQASDDSVHDNGKPEEESAEEPEDESDEDLTSELETLDMRLREEFGDTLTGPNYYTAPVGFFVLIVAILLWLLNPLLGFLNMGGVLGDSAKIAPIAAAILSLAGIHLVFYWSVHRISNLVKSRELDRQIVSRRVDRPCRFLDCYEAEEEEEFPSAEDIINGLDDHTEDTIRWRCMLFETELESNPLCAVCERFQPREGGSEIIRD